MDLTFAARKLEGALTGTLAIGDTTLRFSALSGVAAIIETVPLEQAEDAYTRMMAGKARFRMVLVMKNGAGKAVWEELGAFQEAVVVDIMRIKDAMSQEHWDVIQAEAARPNLRASLLGLDFKGRRPSTEAAQGRPIV